MTETVSQLHIYENNQTFVDWLYPEHGNQPYPQLKVVETIDGKDFSVVSILETTNESFIAFIVYNSTDIEFSVVELNKENVHLPVLVYTAEIISNDIPNRIVFLHRSDAKITMAYLY